MKREPGKPEKASRSQCVSGLQGKDRKCWADASQNVSSPEKF